MAASTATNNAPAQPLDFGRSGYNIVSDSGGGGSGDGDDGKGK